MDGSDADILERMRDNAGGFEAQSNNQDDKVNDGNHYRGLMSVADYKSKRTEVLEDTAEKRELEKKERLQSALEMDRLAASKDAAAKEERERLRKEKLKRQLEEGSREEEEDAGLEKKKKKKKPKASTAAGLSFDADEEG